MARMLNPTAELIPRASDVAIPDILFPKIPPFSELKAMTKLGNFPGAVILRRFRKGEVICRQGDPGWTAFYIPTAAELAAIREAPATQAAAVRAELLKAETKVADLEKQRAEAAADAKKSDSLKGKLAEAREQVGELKERLTLLQAAIPVLEASIARPGRDEARTSLIAAGEAALGHLRAHLAEAEAGGNTGEADAIRAFLLAEVAKKPGHAMQFERAVPRLSGWMHDVIRAEEARKVASVVLAIQLPRPRRPKGFLEWLGGLASRKVPTKQKRPKAIPIDGPRDLDYDTREGVLNEGELFGEMSCLYRSPRSATVTADRDCYMLEMLRNVLDAMNRDAGFKSRLDAVYRDRVLRLQLRNLPILLELDERQVERLSQSAELVEIPSGGLLYDENEPSDAMHLIRGGIIKVMQNVSYLPGEADIADWPALRAELAGGKDPEAGPLHRLWSLLPESVRQSLDAADAGGLEPGARRALLDALNELIKDPALDRRAGLEDLDRAHRVGRKVWQRLADPGRNSEREMIRCHRLLLESLYGNKLPERKSAGHGHEVSAEFRVEEFRDWKAAATALAEGSTRQADPKRRVWDRLDDAAKAALREAKAAGVIAPEGREAVVESLNALLRSRPLLIEPDFQDYLRTKKPAKLIMEFLPGNQAWVESDFHQGCRAYNRALLDVVSPGALAASRRPEGPAKTLAYRSRGETIGEMSLVERKPRAATCVAYGHPEDDPEREVGPIQLVRISRALFEELEGASPAFRRHLENLVAERKAAARPAAAEPGGAAASAGARPGRVEELGLIQGQRLMLIDLERCTRCDECVRACVDTHDDGRSRLFLDGPRYGKYLVPTTCRSCLDPVCMIGCPVGSIHRGGNGEIIIEDWCIGCEACANQCPYGAIQMHKTGLIPESSFGWRYAPASGLPAGWFKASARDRDWRLGSAPFVLDREFRTTLATAGNGQDVELGPIAFRYEVEVEPDLLSPDDRLILTATSMDEGLTVWINGKVVVSSDASEVGDDRIEVSRRKSRDHGWWEIEADLPDNCLGPGKNVVAVRVSPATGAGDRLLDLRLDRDEGETVKLVEEKAVVCDLCSAQFGQRPACVTACPHDAALRVNALTQLPLL